MKRAAIILALAAAVTIGSTACAVQPDEIMDDPVKEARARDLSRELRCMVCQNQSIDDSDAPLARDLRLLVRERILRRGQRLAGDRFPGGALWRVRAAQAALQPAHGAALAAAAAGAHGGRTCAVGLSPAARRAGESGGESRLKLTPEENSAAGKLLAADPPASPDEPQS